NLTRLFGAAVSKKEEKKIDTEGGMMPRRIPALAGSPYRVLAETPCTSTSCHSGVKASFWLSQKAYAGDRLCFQNHGGKGTGRLGSEMKALAKHCGGSLKQ
ncbi:hypothetical protein M8T14_004644, partial [Salmonella enterica]|nr:hypothetical protein [Salmonella enterica]